MVQVQERARTPIRREARVERVEPEIALPGPRWEWVPFAALVLFALALRLFDLGARAMHHDESLHAVYSWYLYVGRGYVHDPLMHGPFLFHLTALMYLLFGDSEVTARLPFVLLGTGAVFLPYFLRYELGRYGALAAAAMLAFEPVLLYFSRFGHNEALLAFQTLLIVVGIFGWVRTRRERYLYAAAVGIALMFSTKVVAYIFGFTVATFFVAALAVERYRPFGVSVGDAIRDIGWHRVGIAAAIFVGIGATLYTTFFTNLEGLCTAVWSPQVGPCSGKQGMLQYWYAQQGVARGSQPWFYYFLLIPLYEVLPLALALAAPFLARRPRSLFFWFCAWWAVLSVLIYSLASEKMPWLVVHLTLPLVMLGAMAIDGPVRRLRAPWGLAPRQWAAVGLTLVALGVLIAWATVGGRPTANPLEAQTTTLRGIALALVAGGVLYGLFRTVAPLRRVQALAAFGVAGLVILGAYSLRTAWQLTYRNGDIPVEILVYVQSPPDAPFIAAEVERIGNQLGTRKELPLLLDGGYTETIGDQSVPHEAVSWPFEWYFRDYKSKQYFSRTLPADFSTGKYPVLLAMGTNLDPIRDDLVGYSSSKFSLNWWYPEDYKQLASVGTVFETLASPEGRLKLLRYVLYRELMNPVQGARNGLGARDLYLYVRSDLARGSTEPLEPGARRQAPAAPPTADTALQVAAVYGQTAGQNPLRDPKGIAVDANGLVYVADANTATVTVFGRDGSVVRTWGRKGEGDGEFNEPWGIAVGPDGSIFVADTWNHRIQKFDSQGRFLAKWGKFEAGAAPAAFYGPRDLAITPAGELLVTDTGNKRIQVFDLSGTFLRSFGTEGSEPGQFREPVGIAVDRQGTVYVADTWNQRIQAFDASFRPLAQYAVQGWSSQTITNKPYVAAAPDGSVYATVPDRAGMVRISDGVLATLLLPRTPRLSMPVGVDVDAQGRLLVGDSRGGQVVVYVAEAAQEASESGSSLE